MREDCSLTSRILGHFELNERVTIIGFLWTRGPGNWYRVMTQDGRKVFVAGTYVSCDDSQKKEELAATWRKIIGDSWKKEKPFLARYFPDINANLCEEDYYFYGQKYCMSYQHTHNEKLGTKNDYIFVFSIF